MVLDHATLCRLAVGWLKRPNSRMGPGCQAAVSEVRGTWDGETPDAIGFRAGVHNDCSVVVEAKISRSDFAADRNKPHRASPGLGMGVYRYFIAPVGLLTLTDLPTGWGLIEALPSGQLVVRCGHVCLHRGEADTWRHIPNLGAEWILLARMLGRIGDAEQFNRSLKQLRNERDQLAKQVERLTHAQVLSKLPIAADGGTLRAIPRRKVHIAPNDVENG